MKKYISLILTLALICALFSGCSAKSGTADPAGPVLPEIPEDQPGVVTIVADHELAKVLREMRPAYKNLLGVEKEDLEIIALPKDSSSRAIKLEQLRTELMAGGGPDAFLLCANSLDLNYVTDPQPPEDLFPFPAQAARSGYFLPLNELIEGSEIIHPEELNPVVMEAGQVNGVQYILPLLYTYAGAQVQAKSVQYPEELGLLRWQERAEENDPVIREAFGHQVSKRFTSVFPALADTSGGKLLVTEEELAQRLREAVELYGSRYTETGEYSNADYLSPERTDPIFYPRYGSTYNLLPLLNTEGKITATVTVWMAVSAAAEHPRKAFSLLELFLHDDFFTTNVGGLIYDSFFSEEKNERIQMPVCAHLYRPTGIFGRYGMTVRDTMLLTTFDNKNVGRVVEGYLPLITSAHFQTPMEKELERSVFLNMYKLKNGGDTEALAHELYTSLVMMLAES